MTIEPGNFVYFKDIKRPQTSPGFFRSNHGTVMTVSECKKWLYVKVGWFRKEFIHVNDVIAVFFGVPPKRHTVQRWTYYEG